MHYFTWCKKMMRTGTTEEELRPHGRGSSNLAWRMQDYKHLWWNIIIVVLEVAFCNCTSLMQFTFKCHFLALSSEIAFPCCYTFEDFSNESSRIWFYSQSLLLVMRVVKMHFWHFFLAKVMWESCVVVHSDALANLLIVGDKEARSVYWLLRKRPYKHGFLPNF